MKDFRCCKLKAEQWWCRYEASTDRPSLAFSLSPAACPTTERERAVRAGDKERWPRLRPTSKRGVRSLLSGDTEGTAGSAGRLGLLTSDLEAPEVSQTSVGSDLLQSFQVLSELGINTVGDELRPGALTDVSLSVQEPLGDVVVYYIGRKKLSGS